MLSTDAGLSGRYYNEVLKISLCNDYLTLTRQGMQKRLHLTEHQYKFAVCLCGLIFYDDTL